MKFVSARFILACGCATIAFCSGTIYSQRHLAQSPKLGQLGLTIGQPAVAICVPADIILVAVHCQSPL